MSVTQCRQAPNRGRSDARIDSPPLRVSLLMRKPYRGRHSVERLFDRICDAMPGDIRTTMIVSSFTGRGVLRRALITVEAMFHQHDVTHVTGDTYFLTLLLRRKTTVLTVLDVLSILRVKGLKGWIFRLIWYRLAMSRASVVTVISEATRRRLIELDLANGHDIRVVPCCTFPEFMPKARPFDARRPAILLTGTAWNKNVERVLEALAGVSCKVRLIGKPTARQLEVARAAGIEFSNASGLSDTDMVREYEQCDMLVLASTEEGFGLPILEAQATGRVVVTSALSSMPEVAGDAAEFVDPYSVNSIRQGVLRVIADDAHRQMLIARGFENVKRFDARLIAEQYAAIYRELAGRNSGKVRQQSLTPHQSSAPSNG